jgi:hypothetical protein
VVAHRAVAARAESEAGRGQTSGAGPPGPVRDPVRPAYRDPVGVPAAGAGLWLGDDLLAAPGGLERGRRLGPAARAAAGETAVEGPAGLVEGGDRLLARPRGPAGPKSGPSPVDRARPGSKPPHRRRTGHPARGVTDRRKPRATSPNSSLCWTRSRPSRAGPADPADAPTRCWPTEATTTTSTVACSGSEGSAP